jgi:hypothetical protein
VTSYSLDASGTLRRRQGDTEAAVPHDRVRPHDCHEHDRDFRPLPVRVLRFSLTEQNATQDRGWRDTKNRRPRGIVITGAHPHLLGACKRTCKRYG